MQLFYVLLLNRLNATLNLLVTLWNKALAIFRKPLNMP